jgi:hypothetical protein
MGKHAEHHGKSDEDEEQHGEKHHAEGIAQKLEHGWQHLEDLTGGRAQIPPAGDQQESNFEHIERHEDAERH